MDIARGGHFTSISKNFPDSSIYHYDDTTCSYRCMTTEFIYWALTSQLDGQDKRLGRISNEWEANTPAKLKERLPGMVDLLLDHPNSMELFFSNGILPGSNSATGATGTYKPPSMTCSNGCGLDGTGCGPQGNSLDVDICPSASSGELMNGEEACENKGLTHSACFKVGNGSCCQWDDDKCYSAIGQNNCPGIPKIPYLYYY